MAAHDSLANEHSLASDSSHEAAPAAGCWRDDDLGTDEHPFGRSFRPLSPRQAEDIAAMPDAVQRNLRITQGYHDLTMDMTCLLGSRNVSWCAFAASASRTAGHFIHGDFLPGMVQTYLEQVKTFDRGLHLLHRLLAGLGNDVWPLRSVLVTSIERVVQDVADNVAMGNQIVFEELAPLFARLIEELRGATVYDPRALQRFLSMLRPGPVQEGGQDLLIAAFGNYHKAMFDAHPKQRAERILLANDQIGYHEQARLQGPIEAALNAPIADIIRHAAHERAREVAPYRLRGMVERSIDIILAPLGPWLQRQWFEVMTRWLMRIELPTRSLRLGQDLSGPGTAFPDELRTIDSADLRALLYELDFTPNTTGGSAARNWGELADRMNYVVDLFRAYQQDESLYRQPFTHAQVEVIRAGGIPDGDL